MKNENNLTQTLIIVAIIIAGGIMTSQYLKQSSIERQVNSKIEAERVLAEAKASADLKIAEGKEDERLRKECLEIFKTEDKKWNNVNSWEYWEFNNSCRIEYKNDKYKEWDKERMEKEGIDEFFTNTF